MVPFNTIQNSSTIGLNRGTVLNKNSTTTQIDRPLSLFKGYFRRNRSPVAIPRCVRTGWRDKFKGKNSLYCSSGFKNGRYRTRNEIA